MNDQRQVNSETQLIEQNTKRKLYEKKIKKITLLDFIFYKKIGKGAYG